MPHFGFAAEPIQILGGGGACKAIAAFYKCHYRPQVYSGICKRHYRFRFFFPQIFQNMPLNILGICHYYFKNMPLNILGICHYYSRNLPLVCSRQGLVYVFITTPIYRLGTWENESKGR